MCIRDRWGISALVLIVLGTGVTTAAAAFLMAGVHLFLGLGLGRNGGDSGEMCQAYLAMFSVQLLAGLWRLVAPETAAAGLYTVAAGLVILALLERGPDVYKRQAYSTILAIPVILVTFVLQRYLKPDYLGGSVKG